MTELHEKFGGDPHFWYADTEFCPCCKVLIDHDVSVSIVFSAPAMSAEKHYECCSRECAKQLLDDLA